MSLHNLGSATIEMKTHSPHYDTWCRRAKATKLRSALSAMCVASEDVAGASTLVLSGSSASDRLLSSRCHSGGDLAVLGKEDGLVDGELGRIDVKVDALDVADGGSVAGGEVEEEVTALDGVGADGALGAGADGNVDELVGED